MTYFFFTLWNSANCVKTKWMLFCKGVEFYSRPWTNQILYVISKFEPTQNMFTFHMFTSGVGHARAQGELCPAAGLVEAGQNVRLVGAEGTAPAHVHLPHTLTASRVQWFSTLLAILEIGHIFLWFHFLLLANLARTRSKVFIFKTKSKGH